MALKSKKKKKEEVAEIKEVEEVKELYTTEEEDIALQDHADELNEDAGRVSIKRMESVVALVENRFNLKGTDSQRPFVMTGFNDKGTKCTVQLANEDYTITVAINDMEVMLGSIE